MDLSALSKDTLISIIHDLQRKLDHYEKKVEPKNMVSMKSKTMLSDETMPTEYIDYRDTNKRLMYKGVGVYLGKDSPRQPNKKRIMCVINGKSRQLFSGSGWNLWIKNDILYSTGNTIDDPIVCIIDQDIRESTRWKQCRTLTDKPYIKEIIRNLTL